MALPALLRHALLRVAAAYRTVPPSLDPQAWMYVATFAAIAVPLGLWSGVLQLKVDKRPAKWLEVRVRVGGVTNTPAAGGGQW
jgi:hypothetical protein